MRSAARERSSSGRTTLRSVSCTAAKLHMTMIQAMARLAGISARELSDQVTLTTATANALVSKRTRVRRWRRRRMIKDNNVMPSVSEAAVWAGGALHVRHDDAPRHLPRDPPPLRARTARAEGHTR